MSKHTPFPTSDRRGSASASPSETPGGRHVMSMSAGGLGWFVCSGRGRRHSWLSPRVSCRRKRNQAGRNPSLCPLVPPPSSLSLHPSISSAHISTHQRTTHYTPAARAADSVHRRVPLRQQGVPLHHDARRPLVRRRQRRRLGRQVLRPHVVGGGVDGVARKGERARERLDALALGARGAHELRAGGDRLEVAAAAVAALRSISGRSGGGFVAVEAVAALRVLFCVGVVCATSVVVLCCVSLGAEVGCKRQSRHKNHHTVSLRSHRA